ncbi:Astacin-like metalloendopeptidase [Papilio machaon]|uniref:Metalloendopeptidase n=1 Tax=Papilio machaon TaxID=76193 RepID=A0A194R1P7_PAPMA|nr:Astacin-like metalloendopeptidase [Papilio machaon]
MFFFWLPIFLLTLHSFYVECVIPNLSVNELDKKLIQRKRQDTLDMCRIFNEETARLEQYNSVKKFKTNEDHSKQHIRTKRNVDSLNPTVKVEDIRRVEGIVDKLYDDMDGNGKVTYRQRRFDTTTTDKTELEFFQTFQTFKKFKTNEDHSKQHIRTKRNVDSLNPTVKVEDIRRVEGIVDKLYDDMDGNGKVTYRQRRFDTTTTDKPLLNKTARRFNFAPAELLGPSSKQDGPTHHDEAEKMPWHKKWKQGIVPYFIDPNTYDSQLSDTIIKAFDYFEKASCIRLQRLRERPTDKLSLQNVEWLYITNPYGIKQCVHSNERKANSGVQMVVFGYDCLSLGEIVHEVMHILGYSHEHTRPDRDQYITIMWDNIKPGYKKYFTTRADDPLLTLSYDYASVLHYPARAFSRNGQATVVTNVKLFNIKIGQRDGLSETDIEKIGMVYGHECVERNRQYLLKTCPSVVKVSGESKTATQDEIEKYFEDRLWPYGIINYKMRDKLEFSAEERENIKAVIRHIEKETCIQFRELQDNDEPKQTTAANQNNVDTGSNNTSPIMYSFRPTPEISDNEIKYNDETATKTIITKADDIGDLTSASTKPSDVVNETSTLPTSRRHAANLLILSRSSEPGCHCPSPGRPNGNKDLKINADCFNSVNELLHLFVHVLGLDHQHNMHDRDSFIHIVWSNLTEEIEEEMQQKLPPAAAAGFPYDYLSVMHYPWLHIKNGVTSIMYPIWNDGWSMGHWQGLSATDVRKLNLIYAAQCSQRKEFENESDDEDR